MSHILIDVNNIIINNRLEHLKNKISPIPQTSEGNMIGVIVCIHQEIKRHLDELVSGKDRLMYINTDQFKIDNYCYVIYNEKREMCEVYDPNLKSSVRSVVDVVMSSFPNNIMLWVRVDITDPTSDTTRVIKDYAENGFRNPYVQGGELYLSRENQYVDFKYEEIANDIIYTLEHYTNDDTQCYIKCRFPSKTVTFLKSMSNMGSSLNKDGNITQKEMAGSMKIVGNNKTDTGEIIYDITINENSIILGEEEGVDVANSVYNFHTHPREAYINHNTSLGWPSCQDFKGYFLSMIKNGTIFHIVIALEGLYVISITKYWADKIHILKVNLPKIENFISKHFDIKYDILNTE